MHYGASRVGRPTSALSSLVSLATRHALVLYRLLVVTCWLLTLHTTWGLWQVHSSPPMLPALSLPRLDVGIVLVATLLIAVVFPKPGAIMNTVVLVYAVVIDQTRLQPEVLGLNLLLWGTVPGKTPLVAARAYLVSLWLFSGFNKLLDRSFLTSAYGYFEEVMGDLPRFVESKAGYLIAFAELATGLTALIPRTRKWSALMALLLHSGILLALGPLGADFNRAVWPWNVALAFAGIVYIAPWKESPLETPQRAGIPGTIVALVLIVSPLGYHVGWMDAYLSHHLYATNLPAGIVCTARDTCETNPAVWQSFDAFGTPMPPERRLFRSHFLITCEEGDTLTIKDPRPLLADDHLTC
jgi:uncharacterized membrane protein YphA (DoxX/SURF4 family)